MEDPNIAEVIIMEYDRLKIMDDGIDDGSTPYLKIKMGDHVERFDYDEVIKLRDHLSGWIEHVSK